MNNLIKLIIKNLIAILLAIPLSFISLPIIQGTLFKVFSLVILVIEKLYPCHPDLKNIRVIPASISSTSLTCFFYPKNFEIIVTILGLIILLIIWYFAVRKLLGKYIK